MLRYGAFRVSLTSSLSTISFSSDLRRNAITIIVIASEPIMTTVATICSPVDRLIYRPRSHCAVLRTAQTLPTVYTPCARIRLPRNG